MQGKQIRVILLSLAVTLNPVIGQAIQVINAQFACNGLLLTNIHDEPQVLSEYYGVSSQFFCANLCLRELACITYRYNNQNKTCRSYDKKFSPVWLANQQICRRANCIPPIAAPTVPNGNFTCQNNLTTYNKPGAGCTTLRNCTCNNILNAPQLNTSQASNPDLCYNTCATASDCLAFSFGTICRVATDPLHLTTIPYPGALLCYY